MGAFGNTRLQRPTEDWTRGDDLPDGDFTFEAWQRILNSMLQYELLDLGDFVGDAYGGKTKQPIGNNKLAPELMKIVQDLLTKGPPQ